MGLCRAYLMESRIRWVMGLVREGLPGVLLDVGEGGA